MGGLAPLSSLNPLTPLSSDTISTLENATGATIAGAAASGASAWLGRGIIIVVGLILIAAGVFSFDKTREVLVSAGKTAGKAAAAA